METQDRQVGSLFSQFNISDGEGVATFKEASEA